MCVCGDRDSPGALTSVAHGAFPAGAVMGTLSRSAQCRWCPGRSGEPGHSCRHMAVHSSTSWGPGGAATGAQEQPSPSGERRREGVGRAAERPPTAAKDVAREEPFVGPKSWDTSGAQGKVAARQGDPDGARSQSRTPRMSISEVSPPRGPLSSF